MSFLLLYICCSYSFSIRFVLAYFPFRVMYSIIKVRVLLCYVNPELVLQIFFPATGWFPTDTCLCSFPHLVPYLVHFVCCFSSGDCSTSVWSTLFFSEEWDRYVLESFRVLAYNGHSEAILCGHITEASIPSAIISQRRNATRSLSRWLQTFSVHDDPSGYILCYSAYFTKHSTWSDHNCPIFRRSFP